MARDTATNASSTEDANGKSKDKTSGKSKDEKDKKDEVEELVCLGGNYRGYLPEQSRFNLV